jgi:hypothetical protein
MVNWKETLPLSSLLLAIQTNENGMSLIVPCRELKVHENKRIGFYSFFNCCGV